MYSIRINIRNSMDNYSRTIIVLLIAALLSAAGAFLFFEFSRQDIEVNPNPETPPLNLGNNNDDEEWRFSTTTEYSLQYPADLNLEYIEMMDWPPTVELTDDEFTCVEAGKPTERAGETVKVTIGGREYCRTTAVEGAAGSTYSQYAYAFTQSDGTAILTFSTRTPQCANYDEAEMEDCVAEMDKLDIDDLADRVARTLVTMD